MDAVNGSAKWMIKFGKDYTQEEKQYAVHCGQNFNLAVVGDSVMVQAGLQKSEVAPPAWLAGW